MIPVNQPVLFSFCKSHKFVELRSLFMSNGTNVKENYSRISFISNKRNKNAFLSYMHSVSCMPNRELFPHLLSERYIRDK